MSRSSFVFELDTLPQYIDALWALIEEYKIVFFEGQLGAGKTTLIRSLCAFKTHTHIVSSPTYALIHEYSIPAKQHLIYHMDLYRLTTLNDILDLGVEEMIASKAYCFIEWGQHLKPILTQPYLTFTLTPTQNPRQRLLTIQHCNL